MRLTQSKSIKRHYIIHMSTYMISNVEAEELRDLRGGIGAQNGQRVSNGGAIRDWTAHMISRSADLSYSCVEIVKISRRIVSAFKLDCSYCTTSYFLFFPYPHCLLCLQFILSPRIVNMHANGRI